jgi:hypothetical protein
VDLALEMGDLASDAEIVRRTRSRIPVLDLLDQILGDNAEAVGGPRLEYRFR